MKVIHGEKKIALILSGPELRYLANCVGAMTDAKAAEHNAAHFPGTCSSKIGVQLWNQLYEAVRAYNKG